MRGGCPKCEVPISLKWFLRSGFADRYRCTGCGSTIKWTILRPVMMVVGVACAVLLLPTFALFLPGMFKFVAVGFLLFFFIYYPPGIYALQAGENHLPARASATDRNQFQSNNEDQHVKTYKPDPFRSILYLMFSSGVQSGLLFFTDRSIARILYLSLFLFFIHLIFFYATRRRPLLRILEKAKVEFVANNGATTSFSIRGIRRLSYSKAWWRGAILKVDHIDCEKPIVVPLSSFRKGDMIEFIKLIQSEVSLETDQELDHFLFCNPSGV